MNSRVYSVPERVSGPKHSHGSGELHKKLSVTDELNLLYEQIKKTLWFQFVQLKTIGIGI